MDAFSFLLERIERARFLFPECQHSDSYTLLPTYPSHKCFNWLSFGSCATLTDFLRRIVKTTRGICDLHSEKFICISVLRIVNYLKSAPSISKYEVSYKATWLEQEQAYSKRQRAQKGPSVPTLLFVRNTRVEIFDLSGYMDIKYWDDQSFSFCRRAWKYLADCRKLGSSSCKYIRHC